MDFLNQSVIVGKRVPARVYYPESVYILLRIIGNKEFLDGKWGEKIVGYTYECVETIDFQHLKVKIEGQKKPLMTDERLQELRMSGKKVFVEFEGETLCPYLSVNKQKTVTVLADSIKADDVRLVNAEMEREIDLD